MMQDLETARDALAQIDGVASCAIGLEANIGPDDYPMIRVVPVRITPGKGYSARTCECTLYFGAKISNSEGLQSVYDSLFSLEAEILAVLKTLRGRYVETVTDEDRLDTYKLMAIRCEISDLSHVRLAAAAALASGFAVRDDAAADLPVGFEVESV
jgi:hypothetical protein